MKVLGNTKRRESSPNTEQVISGGGGSLRRLSRKLSDRQRLATAVIFSLLVGIVGTYLVVGSHAQTTITGVASLQAETMSYPHPASKQNPVTTLAGSSGGKVLTMYWQGTATTIFNGKTASNLLDIKAAGSQCGGPPHMVVTIDNRQVGSWDIYSTTLKDYGNLINFGPGYHGLRISFTNDSFSKACDRNLIVDVTTIAYAVITPPTKPPTAIRTSDASLRLFAPNSPWNTRVDTPPATVDFTSPRRMASLVNLVNYDLSIRSPGTYIAYGTGTSPLYVVDSRVVPLVPVYITNPTVSWHANLDALWKKGVPIPANVLPASGIEGHLNIYDTYTDKLYDFYKTCPPKASNQTITSGAQRCPGQSSPALPPNTWQADFGGVMQHASQSPGYFRNVCNIKAVSTVNPPNFPGSCDKGTISEQASWGATATSLPTVAGEPTIAEMQSGTIKHALAINLPATPKNGAGDIICGPATPTPSVYPAQRSDGSSISANCIPEGAHLRLDPNLNLANYHFSKLGLMLVKAAQQYGMIVRDRTAYEPSFELEDPAAYLVTGTKIDPYTGNAFGSNADPLPSGILGGVPVWAQFANINYKGTTYSAFPWDKVSILTLQTKTLGQ